MLNFIKLRFIVYEIFDNSQLFLTDPRIDNFHYYLGFFLYYFWYKLIMVEKFAPQGSRKYNKIT